MSKADEMFEKLGYEKVDSVSSELAFIKEDEIILFLNKKMGVCIHREKTEYPAFTMQELQAINLKCKELGWIE